VFGGGKFLYIPKKQHQCRLPGGLSWPPVGSIWQCKCGNKYECLGLSFWANVVEWRLIDDEETQLQASEHD